MSSEGTAGAQIDYHTTSEADEDGRMQLGTLAQVPNSLMGALKVEEDAVTGKLGLVAVKIEHGREISEPVKFRLTGMVTVVRLLPLHDINAKFVVRRGTHLKQQIVLVGDGSRSFQMALESLDIIRFMFIQYLPADVELVTFYDYGEDSVVAETPTLTRSSDCDSAFGLPFSSEEDPTGILSSMVKSGKYVRSHSNIVNLKGATCAGDIASAGVCVEAEKKDDGIFYMKVRLESITKLEEACGRWTVPRIDRCITPRRMGVAEKVQIARKVLVLRRVRSWDAVKAANHIYGRQAKLMLSSEGVKAYLPTTEA